MKIIDRQIGHRSFDRVTDLCRLQCRLDDASDADCDLILEVKNLFKRPVEAVGPQMRPVTRIDQLRRDAHSTSGFAHRALKNVADAEFATDLLHIYGLAFVSKTRIARDNKEPPNAAQRGNDLLDHAIGEVLLLR